MYDVTEVLFKNHNRFSLGLDGFFFQSTVDCHCTHRCPPTHLDGLLLLLLCAYSLLSPLDSPGFDPSVLLLQQCSRLANSSRDSTEMQAPIFPEPAPQRILSDERPLSFSHTFVDVNANLCFQRFCGLNSERCHLGTYVMMGRKLSLNAKLKPAKIN